MKKTILILSFVGINNLQGSQEHSHQISSSSANQNNVSAQRVARSAEAVAQLPDFDLLPPVAVHNNDDRDRLARAAIAASQIGGHYRLVGYRFVPVVTPAAPEVVSAQDQLSDQVDSMDIDQD